MGLTVGLPCYFGKAHIGAISGIYYSVRLAGMGVGPAVVGWLAERFNYSRALVLLLALPVLSLAAVVFFRPPPLPKRQAMKLGQKGVQTEGCGGAEE